MSVLVDIWDWMVFNKVATFIIVIVVGFILHSIYTNYKKKKKKLEGPVPPPPILEKIPIDSNFVGINQMESDNIEHYEKMLEYTEREIKEKNVIYEDARKTYNQMIEIDARLKKYIPMLEKQRDKWKREILELKEKFRT